MKWFVNIQIDSWFWFKHDMYRLFTETIPMHIAFKLPRKVIYWCYIKVCSEATTGQYGTTYVSELTIMEALKRFKL